MSFHLTPCPIALCRYSTDAHDMQGGKHANATAQHNIASLKCCRHWLAIKILAKVMLA